jgi:hypothetical protein
VVLGVALAEFLGPVNGTQLRDAVDRLTAGTGGPAPRPRLERLAFRLQMILRNDPVLNPYSLEVCPVRPGVVELHGWVASRALRARAARLAAAAPGVESLINCLLVRGEDDGGPADGRTAGPAEPPTPPAAGSGHPAKPRRSRKATEPPDRSR